MKHANILRGTKLSPSRFDGHSAGQIDDGATWNLGLDHLPWLHSVTLHHNVIRTGTGDDLGSGDPSPAF
ncbi:MAG: hypothetical protein WKF77_22290 [Planctomycetaceae bacterium]